MKTRSKLLIGLVSVTGMFSPVARADSSVTLYGLLEDGFDFVNNSAGKKVYAMRDGTYTGVYGSRWGLLGREELGDGLAAIFKLENGFNVPTGLLGQGGREFGRQAYVGMTDNRLGTATFGRQYDSMVDYLQFATTGSVLGSYASHASDIDNLSNSYRIDNSIKYTSSTFGGFHAGGLVSLTGSSAVESPKQVSVWSVGADYTNGGFRAGVAYFYADQPAQLFTDGAHYLANTTGAAVGATGPWSYVGRPSHVNMFGAAATYLIGATTLAGVYTKSRFADANGTDSPVTFDDYDVSVRYSLSPALKLIAGYLYTVGHISYSGETARYHRVALGIDYSLSKRTEVYGGVFAQQSGGDAKGADLYQGAGAQMSTTDRQLALRVAMIQRF
jgi:predicted porin